MTRGRLAIFSPDGPVDQYYIDGDVVAVGRSSGNDLVIDRHGISRYHISLTIHEHTAELRDLDSVNGTYVDGLLLKPNEGRLLRGGEEIQIGDSRLIYYPPGDSKLDDTVVSQVTSLESQHLAVEMEGPNIAVTPGTSAPATLNLRNTSNQELKIHIDVEGLPRSWVRIDRNDFRLAAGHDIDVGVTFKPSRRPESKPGRYDVKITLSFAETRFAPVNIETQLDILQFNGYGAVLGTPLLEAGEPFQLYIHNQGNGSLPLRFHGEDKGNLLTYQITPDTLTLGPGERKVINGTVRPKRRRFIGQETLHEYVILTKSLAPAGFVAPVSGEVRLIPLVRPWTVPLLFLPLVALVVLIGALVLPSGEGTQAVSLPAPVINGFTVNGQNTAFEVQPDTPLVIEWTSQHADAIEVVALDSELNVAVQAVLATSAPGSHLLYLPRSDTYTVQLSATNATQTTTADPVTVTVTPVIMLRGTVFLGEDETQYTTLYRNVIDQQLVVEWLSDRQQAEDSILSLIVQSNGNPQLTRQTVINDTNGVYTLDIDTTTMVETVSPVRLQLVGDGFGASVTIPVLYPACVVERGTISVYTAPGIGDEGLMTLLPAQTRFRLDGRNPAGWVRIIVPAVVPTSGYYGWVSSEALQNADCTIRPEQLSAIQN